MKTLPYLLCVLVAFAEKSRTVSIARIGDSETGPITWDDTKCSTECSEGSKYLYADGKTYVYNYEATNTLHMEGSPEILSSMKASVEITKIASCEMILQIKDLSVQHGSHLETSSTYIDDLQRNALPFSWDDGVIRDICPSPEDKPDVVNVKRAILSALQNSMKSTWHDLFLRETDVLGSCDTDYRIISSPPDHQKTLIRKTKNLASCSPHIQVKTAFLSTPYDSHASPIQDLPLLTKRELTCDQVLNNGVMEEIVCQEEGGFTPLSDFGYGVNAKGEIKMHLTSTRRADATSPYKVEDRKSLTFEYQPKYRHFDDSEAEAALRDFCPKVSGLLEADVGDLVHKTVNIIRGLSPQSVEHFYNSLKYNNLCDSPKLLGIYLDSLKMSSTEGAVQLLTKLTVNHEISETEIMLWLLSMTANTRPDEGALRAALPLLEKDVGSQQAFLSVSAMVHKFCLHHPDCESVPVVKELISTLDKHLGVKCHSSSDSTNDEIITTLKAYGNLGRVGDSRDKILDCALNTENKSPVRIAAVEAFRRTPCSETGRVKLLELFGTTTEETEERIAAFLTLVKCPSSEFMTKVKEIYEEDVSNQVKSFVWSYFENLKTTSDPSKRQQKYLASQYLSLERPSAFDVTKFSRNFQNSLFSEILNMGGGLESSLIFTKHSFLPRSLNTDLSVDFFGHKLNLLEMGLRTVDVEYYLEKLFGPRGTLSKYNLNDLYSTISGNKETQASSSTSRRKRATNPYQQKFDVLDERVNFIPWHPQGSFYIRILGNELRWRRFDIKANGDVGDLDIQDVLKRVSEYQNVDTAHSFMFLDTNFLIPSVTGRAYELAGNGSVTVGLKAQGKFDIQQPNFPHLNADVDGTFQPSAAVELSASMTLHSEDYEPGFKVRTSINIGRQSEIKIQMVNGRKIYTKLNFPGETNKIFNLKREFYVVDQDGERTVQRGDLRKHEYCTESLSSILGVQICGKMELRTVLDKNNKPFVPVGGPLTTEITVRKTDASMTGYEFIAQMPEQEDSERIYKLSIDTPGSTQDRKYSTEIKVTHPHPETCNTELQFHTPSYTLDGSTTYVSRSDNIQLRVQLTGNKVRHYEFNLDVEKNIRGARLAEYKPSLMISLPNRDPLQISGTVVFARGNKEQLSIDLSSDSFGSPLKVKGNFAKEGDIYTPESTCRLATDVTVNYGSGTYRLQGTTEKQAQDYSSNIRVDYQPPESDSHSVQLVGKLMNFHLYNPTRFALETDVRISQFPNFNTQLKWDFSIQLLEHIKNDITFRYGRDFEDDTHLIHLKQVNKLQGDFGSYTKMDYVNELAFKAPCIDFDKAVVFTVSWDFAENPKLFIEVGARSDNVNELKAEINYHRLSIDPVKITTEAKFIYFGHEYVYRDQLQQIAPKELQGNVVIESHGTALVTVDYVYKIKSDQRKLHHEIDSTIVIPGRLMPIQQKAHWKYTRSSFQLYSHTDTGSESPYVIDVKLSKIGQSEISLQLPALEGRLIIDSKPNVQTIDANFKSKRGGERRIIAKGALKAAAISTLDLEIQFDGDHDPQKVVITVKGSSTEADTGDKYDINANINYMEAVNADISGFFGKNILLGPHYFRADFSGNMEPTSLVLSHQIVDWNLESFIQYLRSDVEKLRADLKGKFVQRAYHLDVEGGISVVSPFKAFDGKELYYKLYVDSSGSSRSFQTEYRLKYATDIGYVGRVGYSRKRGWPGNMKGIILFTVDNRPVYEAKTELEYGNRRYALTTNLIPSPKKRFNLDTSFEYAARYAGFHYSTVTSLQHLQSVSLNAIADLRRNEDMKILTDFSLNNNKLYDVNATLSSRSITDFEGHVLLFSKITPSIRIRTKTNNANSLTKYTLNVQKGDEDIVVGNGELRKRKKGYTSDIAFKYRENEIMSLSVQNEAKSHREQNYAVKAVIGSSTYTANVHYGKERKGTKKTFNLCAVSINKCVEISTLHKDTDTKDEWTVTYKRDDVELHLERTVVHTGDNLWYRTLIRSGERVYGYDIKFRKEGEIRRFYLGLLSTHRDMNLDLEYNLNVEDLKLKLGLQTDAKRFPERKLVLQVQSKTAFGPQSSTETEISLSHPIFEQKIELKLLGNFDIRSSTLFSAELSADYSTNPDHKLITKIRVETLEEGTGATLYVDIYHKDDQHLLVAFESGGTLTADDLSLQTRLKLPSPSGGDKQVNIKADWIFQEHKVQAVYNRPGMDSSLTAVEANPTERKTVEVDIEYIVNGETTHSKLVYYVTGDCMNIDFTVPQTVFSHKTEICYNKWSRNLLSVHMETIDEENGLMHNSMEVIHQDYGVVKVRNQWNTDFIGLVAHHLVALVDEVSEALSSPPETEEIFNSMSRYVNEKIAIPLNNFLSSGFVRLMDDIKNEIDFFKQTAAQYYGYLPPIRNLLDLFEPVCAAIRNFYLEILSQIREHYPGFTVHFDNLLHRWAQLVGFLQNYCSANSFCPALINAIAEGSYIGFIEAIQEFVVTLPDQIKKFTGNSEAIRDWIMQTSDNLMLYLKRLVYRLEPLLHYRYISDARKLILSSYESLKDQYGEELSAIVADVLKVCQDIRRAILDNERVRRILEYVREEFTKLRIELQEVDLKELYIKLQKLIEEYLSNARLPSSELFFKMNTFNSERGVLDVDFYTPVDVSVLKRILISLLNLRHLRPQEIRYALTTRAMVANLKRMAEFNFLPPYEEQAMIVGKQHFITFDKHLYDFVGECSYLLARDFDNGNFSLIAKYPEKSADEELTVIVMVGQVTLELNIGDKSVKVDDKPMDLPFLSSDLRAVHEDYNVIVDDRHGVTLKCHTVHKLCSLMIPGWYFGKTAGLFGTYNYESFDDFKRPRGHIAQNVVNFAKSWELSKGCKTKNIAREALATEGSESYRICHAHFRSIDSSLADCFTQVDPLQYLNLCLRHLPIEANTAALCSVATAYVSECEKNYLEINLPPECLVCEAPDGSVMKHGERKKIEDSQKNIVDLVFLVENHSCNKELVRDLNSLARSIDREFLNDDFSDNLYSVVSYGGPEDEQFSHTVHGKTAFRSQDVMVTMENFATQDKPSSSSSALEALKYAVGLPFRSGSSKTFVLLACTPCKYNFQSLAYPVVQQLLLEHAINLHVINHQELVIKKVSARRKDIVGVDAETVYSVRDVTQRNLIGEPTLRSQVTLPKDMCIALSQDVNGSFFSSKSLDEGTPTDHKNWRSIFARRVLKTTKSPECQFCDCTSTEDHVPKTVCQPCVIQRPRLPFTVCKECTVPRYVEALVSFLSHLAS